MKMIFNPFFLLLLTLSRASEYYCPSVATPGLDRRSNSSTFRVMQFNAEWLFVDGADNCPGSTCPWSTNDIALEHISAIAGVIADINPDFINLCEVESCNELNLLTMDSRLAKLGYKPYMVQGTDSATGQDVGILTRIDPNQDLYRTESRANYPLPSSTCKSSYSGSYGVSKHYITTVQVNSLQVAIIGAHLLAFPDDQNRCVEREAQATILQEIAQSYASKGYEVMIIGDINDWEDVYTDANDNIPISQVSAILKGSGAEYKLTNIAGKLQKSERYSEWYDENSDCIYNSKETSSIDHIFVSDGLLNRVTNVFIAHSEYAQSCSDFYFSDHWPLVVDFDV